MLINSQFYIYGAGGSWKDTLYYTHDLQKNVTALFGGQVDRRAKYQYDAYGNLTLMEGDAAEENPYRYSSEYHDADLGLIYYNYRHYNPTDGRWITRDPIAENGGENLYEFVKNLPSMFEDWLGLEVKILSEKYRGIYDSSHYAIMSEQEHRDFANTIAGWLNRLLGMLCGVVVPEQTMDEHGVMYYTLKLVAMPAFVGKCLCPNPKCLCAVQDLINGSDVFTIVYLDQTNNASYNHIHRRVKINPHIQYDATVHLGDTITGPVFGIEAEDPAITFWHEIIGHGLRQLTHADNRLSYQDAWIAEMGNRINEINKMIDMLDIGELLSPVDRISLYPAFKDIFFDENLEHDNIARECLTRNGGIASPIAPFYHTNSTN